MGSPSYEIRVRFAALDDSAAVSIAAEIDRLVHAQSVGTDAPQTNLFKTATTNIPWTTWRPGDRVT